MAIESATVKDLKEELIAAFPAGIEDVIDFDDPDGPGPFLEAVATVLKERGTDQVDQLRDELCPTTATSGTLLSWEKSLNVDQNKIALGGSVAARRNQVNARLRERGTLTKGMIQAVVGLLLDYSDVSQLVVLECPRDLLRAAHTRSNLFAFGAGIALNAPITSLFSNWRDDPRVAESGPQVDLDIAGNVANVAVTLTGPGGQAQTWAAGTLGRGTRVQGDWVRVYFPSLAGVAIFGTWTLLVTGTAGETLYEARLFCEATGRYLDYRNVTQNGLGSEIFHWGVVAEESKMGANADVSAALAALKRISYGGASMHMVRRTGGTNALAAGKFAMFPGNLNAFPNESIPGT